MCFLKLRPSVQSPLLLRKLSKSIAWGFGINSQGETGLIWSFSQMQMSLLDSASGFLNLVNMHSWLLHWLGILLVAIFTAFKSNPKDSPSSTPRHTMSGNHLHTLFKARVHKEILISTDELLMFPLAETFEMYVTLYLMIFGVTKCCTGKYHTDYSMFTNN